MQAEMEITKKKEEVKGDLKDSYRSTEAKQKLLQNVMGTQAESTKKDMSRELGTAKKDLARELQFARKDLQNSKKKE